MQHSLMLYEFEMDLDAVEATKRICCAKGEDTVDHSRATRGLKKFYKNFDNQAKSETVDSDILPQNPQKQIQWEKHPVSGVFHSLVWFITFTTSAKTSGIAGLCLTLPKYCKIFDSPKIWQLVFGECQVSSTSHCLEWFTIFLTWAKASRTAGLCLTLSKYCKTFNSS